MNPKKNEGIRIRDWLRNKNAKPVVERPFGVTLLAVAAISGAMIMVSAGSFLVTYAPLIHRGWHSLNFESSYWSSTASILKESMPFLHVNESLIILFGQITTTLAIIPAVISFGLLRGRSWGGGMLP